MTKTVTLNLETLIQTTRAKAERHRALSHHHNVCPELADMFAQSADAAEQQARELEAIALLEQVQQDPFQRAAQEAGAMQLRNGRLTAGREVLRQMWPHAEQKPAVAARSRWPF